MGACLTQAVGLSSIQGWASPKLWAKAISKLGSALFLQFHLTKAVCIGVLTWLCAFVGTLQINAFQTGQPRPFTTTGAIADANTHVMTDAYFKNSLSEVCVLMDGGIIHNIADPGLMHQQECSVRIHVRNACLLSLTWVLLYAAVVPAVH